MNAISPLMLRLTLGVSPKRADRPRWLWSSQVMGLGETPEPVAFCEDVTRLTQRLGVPCEAGIEACVAKPHAPMMSAAMHLALAMRLRAQGHAAAAEVVESVLQRTRRADAR